jgi:hypothetical protein
MYPCLNPEISALISSFEILSSHGNDYCRVGIEAVHVLSTVFMDVLLLFLGWQKVR